MDGRGASERARAVSRPRVLNVQATTSSPGPPPQRAPSTSPHHTHDGTIPLFVLSPASLAHSALFAGYYSYLTLKVAGQRLRTGYYIGEGQGSESDNIKHGGNAANTTEDKLELSKAVRAHGNFVESVPLAFGFIFLAELNGAPTALVHGAYLTLFGLRVLQANFGILTPGADGFGRPIGTLGTVAVTALAGLYNLNLGWEPLKSFLGF